MFQASKRRIYQNIYVNPFEHKILYTVGKLDRDEENQPNHNRHCRIYSCALLIYQKTKQHSDLELCKRILYIMRYR